MKKEAYMHHKKKNGIYRCSSHWLIVPVFRIGPETIDNVQTRQKGRWIEIFAMLFGYQLKKKRKKEALTFSKGS
jgi:hypothetical protein